MCNVYYDGNTDHKKWLKRCLPIRGDHIRKIKLKCHHLPLFYSIFVLLRSCLTFLFLNWPFHTFGGTVVQRAYSSVSSLQHKGSKDQFPVQPTLLSNSNSFFLSSVASLSYRLKKRWTFQKGSHTRWNRVGKKEGRSCKMSWMYVILFRYLKY